MRGRPTRWRQWARIRLGFFLATWSFAIVISVFGCKTPDPPWKQETLLKEKDLSVVAKIRPGGTCCAWEIELVVKGAKEITLGPWRAHENDCYDRVMGAAGRLPNGRLIAFAGPAIVWEDSAGTYRLLRQPDLSSPEGREIRRWARIERDKLGGACGWYFDDEKVGVTPQ
jgi:hypothetical protein